MDRSGIPIIWKIHCVNSHANSDVTTNKPLEELEKYNGKLSGNLILKSNNSNQILPFLRSNTYKNFAIAHFMQSL